MQVVSIRKGKHFHVFAVARHDIALYRSELYDKLDIASQRKIAARIDFLSDEKPPIKNDQVCKKLKGYDNLFELRAKQVRLFYFQVGDRIIITHGYVKKSNSTDRQEISRAETLKCEFQSSQT